MFYLLSDLILLKEYFVVLLLDKYNIPLIFLTLGKDGSRAYCKNGNLRVEVPTFDCVTPIEKTGAGDTFMGCALSFILDKNSIYFTEEELKNMLLFSNAGASLITERKGALKVMPSKEEILALLKE